MYLDVEVKKEYPLSVSTQSYNIFLTDTQNIDILNGNGGYTDGPYDTLHDGLFSFYWDWKKKRNKDWKLDILENNN